MLCMLIIAAGLPFLVNDAMAKAEEGKVDSFKLKNIDPLLFILGLMGFGGMFCEGTVYDWSGVYFSTVVQPDAMFLRAGYIAGMGAMTLGRFMGDRFVTRYGAAKVLSCAVCSSSVDCGLPRHFLILCQPRWAFFSSALASARQYQSAIALPGRLGTIKASIAITIVSSISFFGFLVGLPSSVGFPRPRACASPSASPCFGLFIALLSRKIESSNR